MAAIASPLLATSSSNHYAETHRLLNRRSLRSTDISSYQTRRSPRFTSSRVNDVQSTTNDSSDDDDLAPIKLSAEAQAILGEDNSKIEIDQENVPLYREQDGASRVEQNSYDHKTLRTNGDSLAARHAGLAPKPMRTSSSRPSPPKTLARDGSFMYKIHEKNADKANSPETNTPVSSLRRIRVSGSRNQTRSPPSSSRTRPKNDDDVVSGHNKLHERDFVDDEAAENPGLAHPSTILRQRRGEEQNLHSTMRVRRIGTGALLHGPVRRGMIRRQSDEDNEHHNLRPVSQDNTPEVELSRRAKEPDLEDLPDQPLISYGSPKHQMGTMPKNDELAVHHQQQSPPHATGSNKKSPSQRDSVLSTSISKPRPTPASTGLHLSSKSSQSSSSNRKPIFRIPSLPPLESTNDQENEPPPTFKRTKPSAPVLEVHEDQRPQSPKPLSRSELKERVNTMPASPPRQPLVALSNNTPHRSAPAPPPKMSLVDAATSAGANSRSKKSVHCALNGRIYRRLDVIGRGGTSRVFRIMAENYQIFALKRVNLDEADSAAIAGMKGEIDLLKKLEAVDRVVRLFDYEVNQEKGTLSVMMELGESDFNKMLNEQLKTENAKLDVTFTRHYWKEMLECVKAVHDHEIVHSDLKPANFLLVKGRLKLIDFGIAGAIQDDTVNVHRENQIGTPNYMSPESLVCHTPPTGQAGMGTKLLKLGKPSDVWSLGCILYQMTYGQPPFAHIPKHFERIMSIPNPKVEIQFPGVGVGGAVVPFGLIKTLRRCLQRDQTLRPTVDELLSDADPFLHPVAISPDMLGRFIGNVVGYCRKREEKLKDEGKLTIQDGLSVLPRDEEMRVWPGALYEKLREASREGTAW